MADNVVMPSVFHRRLRVMLVEGDVTYLNDIKKQLESCSYEVTAVEQASAAVSMLEQRRCQFDLLLADVQMPDMDGFEFLKIAVLTTNLPIILMSGNCDASLALRAIEEGAWSFIGKPVAVDVLKNLWQYAFQHKKSEMREIEKAAWLALKSPEKALDLGNSNEANNASNESSINKLTDHREEIDLTNQGNQGVERSKRKSSAKEKESDEYKEDESKEKKNVAEENGHTTEKKQMRATWTEELHQKFVNAINKIGKGKIGPRKILELMDEPGLTPKQVASHLQKYRQRVRNNENLSESEEQVYSRTTDRRPLSQHPNLFLYHGTKLPSPLSSQNPEALPLAPTGFKNCYGRDPSIANDVHSQVCGQPSINTTELPALFSNAGTTISSSSNVPDPALIGDIQVNEFCNISTDQNMDDLDDLLERTLPDDNFYAQQFSDFDFEELFPGEASGGADATTRDMDTMECQFDEGALQWHPPS